MLTLLPLLAGLTLADVSPVEPAAAPARTLITTNPLNLLVSFLDVEIEQSISGHWSLFGSAGYSLNDSYLILGTTGPVVALGAHWYPAGLGPRGFFVAPQTHLFLSQYYGPMPGGGLTLGYSVVAGRLVMSFGAGANVLVSLSDDPSKPTRRVWTLPAIRVNLGFAI